MNNNENEFLDWNSGFIAAESEYTLLPAGEYSFTVKDMERKIYDGTSDKIPNGAPYVEVSFEIIGAEGKTTVKERIYLMQKWAWKLTQFFASIGQNPIIGQPFNPNWGTVIGSTGQVKLEINKYTDRQSGGQRENNRIKEFLKSTTVGTQQPPQQNYTQPATQQNYSQPATQNQPPQQQGGFTPGAF